MIVTPSPRVWLVTGASTGFGRALACHALDNGEIVISTMRNPDSDTLAFEYPDHLKRGKLTVLKLDVTDPEEVTAAFATAKEKYGRLDVVFNNAGWTQAVGEIEQIPEEQGRALFDTNFWGAAIVSQEAMKLFRENTPPGGRLLQNSSGSALQAVPGTGYYGASKAALEAFTEALVQEIDPAWNIKITVIEPGPFNTKIIGKGLTVLPPHPAYTDPSLGVNISRMWMTTDTLSPIAGDVQKAAIILYRLSTLEDPPFRLPLHPRVIARAKHRIQTLQEEIDGLARWSEEAF